MKRGTKISKTKQAKKAFKFWYEAREDKEEVFKQCKEVPYWFVSNKNKDSEMVISFYNPQYPKFLKQVQTQDGYWLVNSTRNGKKSYYIHRLQAVAFDSYAYGKAKKNKNLRNVEVHHLIDLKNEPSLLEVLRREVHNNLFNTDNVPNLSDNEAKQYKYINTINQIIQSNTPEQCVVILSGATLRNGIETNDSEQLIYADDFEGVTDLAKDSLKKLKESEFIVYIPESKKDRINFEKLLEEDGEAERLKKHVILCSHFVEDEDLFFVTYQDVNLIIRILSKRLFY